MPSSTSNGSNTTNNVANILNGFDNYNDDDDDGIISNDDTNNAHQKSLLFTPKFQYSVKNNPLCGICFSQWLTILRLRYNQIEFGTYWPRIIVITLLSIFNSVLAYIESIYYPSDEIAKIEINIRPVFILGHPRTGTTLLHSLLALDVEKFDICTTFCSGFPSCFLWFESIGKVLFGGVIDSTRPMDNMPLHFDLPQEDELATNLLSGGKCSPYMPLFFMKQEREFRPYYTFQQQTEDLLDEDDENIITEEQLSQDRNQWINSFLFLLKKLTLRGILQRRQNEKENENATTPEEPNNNNTRRLLLKSPVHTARIKLLLQLFPNAQFIYIHRHPYDILRSAIHMADTTYWYTYLNTPSDEEILEFILRQYEILWESYEHDRQLLQKQQQQLIEVSFEDLTRNDPLVAIQNVYKNLGWGELSSNYKSKLESQLSSRQHTTYQRNNHKQLPDYLKSIVNKRWKESFDRLGYTMDEVKKIDDES